MAALGAGLLANHHGVKRPKLSTRRVMDAELLGLVILGWATQTAGYAVILILSIVALVYFLVQAPLTCGADIRKGDHCRNNSHGLLLGC
jgi:hypothetical protein